ncbi:MAG: hypothetical protein ATN31_08875 [Candidatus Epulonipiscioides saccharophilum]|nr:MAG: hypothetical protein ATN31_08875 [Epulopiscium sp. AS2M-Bin001]
MHKLFLVIVFAFIISVNISAKEEKFFDVIVIGTDPEGISAAISSARNGMKTLLIDKRDRVGGLYTLGGLNSLDMNCTSDGILLTQGIFREFFFAIDPVNEFADFWHRRDSFSTSQAEEIFNKMIAREPNLTLQMGADKISPVVKNDIISSIKVNQDGRENIFYGKIFIDSTQNADICLLSGVPYKLGGSDINDPSRKQAITQIFRMKGVKIEELKQAVDSEPAYQAKMNTYSTWGFLDIMRRYQPIYDKNIKVRGLNIGFENEDTVLINAMQMIGFNSLSDLELDIARELAKVECKNIASYIIEEIPGFEGASYAGEMEELYIRESRHIVGEYQLKASDMMSHKDFYDKIAWGGYPIDIQTTNINNFGYIVGDPEAYSVPLRSIVPKKINNLLVASKNASYHSIGFGSVRVVPIGMAVGQGAGVVAAYANNHNITLREIAYDKNIMKQIQQALIKQGAFLEDMDLAYNYKGHEFEEGIAYAYDTGILLGSYENKIKLEEPVLSSKIIEAINKFQAVEGIMNKLDLIDLKDEYASGEQLANIIYTLLKIEETNLDKRINLYECGVISEKLFQRLNSNATISNSGLYQMLYESSRYLSAQSFSL